MPGQYEYCTSLYNPVASSFDELLGAIAYGRTVNDQAICLKLSIFHSIYAFVGQSCPNSEHFA